MRSVAAFVRFAEGVNDAIGRWVAWLSLATVLICALVVFLRYALETGYIWLQELFIWSHATVFMVGAGFTFMAGRHVRVDVYYSRRTPRTRAWLDLVSTVVFLFPWIIVLAWHAWPYVLASWALHEESSQIGGMPGLYLMKTVILVFCALMGLQGLAVIGRSILVINGRDELAPARIVR